MTSPQCTDPIIAEFKPVTGQWELNDENISRIESFTGETILHNYCKYMHTTPLEVFKFLIEIKHLDINLRDKSGNSPLYEPLHSFQFGSNLQTLLYLFNLKGLDIISINNRGHSLLSWACVKMTTLPLEVFKCLIEIHSGDINSKNGRASTPLHDGIQSFEPSRPESITVLNYLLSQKINDPDIEDNHHLSLLSWACMKINTLPLDVFKNLVEIRHCDINSQDRSKRTPLHYALEFYQPETDTAILTYLFSQNGLDAKFLPSLLLSACQNINALPIDVFKCLITVQRCDVNALGSGRNTPLHTAFLTFKPNGQGDVNILKYLLNTKGVDLTIRSPNNLTLLHQACINPPGAGGMRFNNFNSFNDFIDLGGRRGFGELNPYGGFGGFGGFGELNPYGGFGGFGGYNDGFQELFALMRDPEIDTVWGEIVQTIAEKFVQQLLDEAMS
jgi:ankyrin repeat protein